MNAMTRGVELVGDPSSLQRIPTTMASRPSSSPDNRSIVATIRSTASSAPSTRTVASGRASVRDASLMARPIRRSPTSMPSTRMRPMTWNHGSRLRQPQPQSHHPDVIIASSPASCETSALFAHHHVSRRRAGVRPGASAGKVSTEARHPRFRRHGSAARRRSGWTKASCRTCKKLAERGSGIQHLETTHSPESPTAWASFATGVNAGKHNIYDFLIRDTNTYLPDLGMVHLEPPRFILNYFPVSKPSHAIDSRGHVVLGHGRTRGRAIERADGAGHIPSGRCSQRRTALRPAAARHSPDDGDVLLLRYRSEPVRRGQHRVRRHPEAARLRRRRRPDRAGRSAEPDRQTAASRRSAGSRR